MEQTYTLKEVNAIRKKAREDGYKRGFKAANREKKNVKKFLNKPAATPAVNPSQGKDFNDFWTDEWGNICRPPSSEEKEAAVNVQGEVISPEVEEVWNGFWKDIVCNPDGTVNLNQVKKELSDFHYIMGEVSKVYCNVTGNRLSKIMYAAETVIAAADQYTQELIDQETKELEEELQKLNDEPSGMRWVKGEYERLYEQAKNGKRIVCYVDYAFVQSPENTSRDICTLKLFTDRIEFVSRGHGYGTTFHDQPLQDFVERCESDNIEWLDTESPSPIQGEEVDPVKFATWAVAHYDVLEFTNDNEPFWEGMHEGNVAFFTTKQVLGHYLQSKQQ